MTRLLALVGKPTSEKFFFPAIRFQRVQALQKKKLTWSWKSVDYKVYPSGLKSWTMCPHRYVHEDVHEPPSWGIEAPYKMEVGTYLHKMFQDCANSIEEFPLLYAQPDFSKVIDPPAGSPELHRLTKAYEEGEFYKDTAISLEKRRKIREMQKAGVHLLGLEMQSKMHDIVPEIPVYDWESGVSGRADAVLDMYGQPVVFDIKTKSVEDVRKSKKTNEWEENLWAEAVKKYPSEDHKIQVSVYCYLINKFKFYDKPVRKAGLGYVNLLMKAGDPNAEYEVYFDFDEEMEKRIGLLLEHISLSHAARSGGSC